MAALTCIACGQDKDSSEFNKRTVSPTGYDRFCRPCRNEYRRTWSADPKNRDKAYARTAAWREKNPEKVRDYSHKYWRENKEQVQERRKPEWNKKYYESNKERISECSAQRYQDNREEMLAKRAEYKKSPRGRVVCAKSDAKRRLIQKQVPAADVDSILDLQEKSPHCYLCGEKMVDTPYHPHKRTLEHRIPLARGGTNELENLAFACYSCNCKKQAMTEEEYRARLEKRKDIK